MDYTRDFHDRRGGGCWLQRNVGSHLTSDIRPPKGLAPKQHNASFALRSPAARSLIAPSALELQRTLAAPCYSRPPQSAIPNLTTQRALQVSNQLEFDCEICSRSGFIAGTLPPVQPAVEGDFGTGGGGGNRGPRRGKRRGLGRPPNFRRDREWNGPWLRSAQWAQPETAVEPAQPKP